MNADEVKIEKGIPRPARYANNARSKWGEALSKLKVGDSFIYTGKSISNMFIYGKVRGIKLSTHKNADGTFRVWRVK